MDGGSCYMDVDQPGAVNAGSASSPEPGTTGSNPRLRALSPSQERRIVAYLDERFLQFTRNFKKRSEASSTLPTLSSYLEEARHLLALILQIPPIDPSTSLRTAYLLHLTGDVVASIPGYSLTKRVSDPLLPDPDSQDGPIRGASAGQVRDTLRDLLDFLDDLDQAWLAVLQCQVWDASTSEGTDLTIASESVISEQTQADEPQGLPAGIKSTAPSQTEITRLRSLLVGGGAALEEWLANEKVARLGGVDGDDLSGMLDQMGLLDEFDDLFTCTLDLLGTFVGASTEPGGVGEEIPMT